VSCIELFLYFRARSEIYRSLSLCCLREQPGWPKSFCIYSTSLACCITLKRRDQKILWN